MVAMTNSDNGSILALIRRATKLQAWPRLPPFAD